MTTKHKHLTCGCCGSWFMTWDGYVDQDQDKGYGICKSCQQFIADKEKAEMDKAIKLLTNALNEKNRKNFMGLHRTKQQWVVMKAFNDGILNFTITHK